MKLLPQHCRSRLLSEIKSQADDPRELCRELLAAKEDGRVKMYLTWRVLQARKAHPGLRVSDLDDLAQRLAGAGYEPKWDTDLPDIRRFHVSDPVGNRLEIIQEAHQAGHA